MVISCYLMIMMILFDFLFIISFDFLFIISFDFLFKFICSFPYLSVKSNTEKDIQYYEILILQEGRG